MPKLDKNVSEKRKVKKNEMEKGKKEEKRREGKVQVEWK